MSKEIVPARITIGLKDPPEALPYFCIGKGNELPRGKSPIMYAFVKIIPLSEAFYIHELGKRPAASSLLAMSKKETSLAFLGFSQVHRRMFCSDQGH